MSEIMGSVNTFGRTSQILPDSIGSIKKLDITET
jgi:hypothetical protein